MLVTTHSPGARPKQPRSEWRLPCEPASVGAARDAARQFLRSEAPAANQDAVLLLVSELVTNAVLHTAVDRPIALRLGLTAGHVHIEVDDADPHQPVLRSARPDDDSGRGLLIVDSVAERWGWHPVAGQGKRVWCDVGRS